MVTLPDAPDDPIRVLFVCTHNSARSQIAEAILGRDGGTDFAVASAGTEATGVNPHAVQVVGELGIDWTEARSKLVTEFLDQRFDYVITVCDRAKAICPVFPGSGKTLHWSLDDPSEVEATAEEKLAAFRQTRSDVSGRLVARLRESERSSSGRCGSTSGWPPGSCPRGP